MSYAKETEDSHFGCLQEPFKYFAKIPRISEKNLF